MAKTGKYANWGITQAVINWANGTGITGATSIKGVCTDFNTNISMQAQDEPNEYGTTIGRVVTDEIAEGSATILVSTSATLPNSARTPMTLSINGKTFLVSSLADIQSNRNWRKIQVRFFGARNITTADNQWDCETPN